MAVIDPLDVAVEVRVDGEELAEYPDDNFDRRNTNVVRPGDSLFEGARLAGTNILGDCKRPKKIVVSKYIQAVPDSEFTVAFCLGLDMPFKQHTTRVAVHVDGKFGDSRFVNWNYKPKSKVYRDEMIGVRKGVNSNNPQVFAFRFARLNIVENARRIGNESAIGTIHVIFWRVYSWRGGKARKWEGLRSADASKVSEKRLKKGEGVSVGIGYTEPYNGKKYFTTNREYIDGKEYPFAEVRFKLRDKKALQDLLIIPRTPCRFWSPLPIRTSNTATRNDEIEDNKAAIQLFPHGQEIGDDAEDMEIDDTSSSTDREDSVVFVSERPNPQSTRSQRPAAGDIVHEIFDDDDEDDNEVLTSRRHVILTNETIVIPDHDLDEARPGMNQQAQYITIPDDDDDDAFVGTNPGFPQGTNYIVISDDDDNGEASSGPFQDVDCIMVSDDEDDDNGEGNSLFLR